jgi:hypothetical protein
VSLWTFAHFREPALSASLAHAASRMVAGKMLSHGRQSYPSGAWEERLFEMCKHRRKPGVGRL